MTRVGARLLVAALLTGCGSLQPNDAGVAVLEVHPPLCNGVEVGSTVDFKAFTFDQSGDPVDAPVWWRTPDGAAIDVDSATGTTTGLLVSDTARVQALVGADDPLVSDFVPLVVTPVADTLERTGAARVTVDASATGSGALVVKLSRTSPAKTIKSFPLSYAVIDPVFTASEDRTIEFPGGKLALTVCTAPTGLPAPDVRLVKRAGRTPPDSAIVEVTARHADGVAVPGSGTRFTIVFTNP